jgi:hypothetical protein
MMSRDTKHRRRLRKQRRKEKAEAPSARPLSPETRDPRTRWTGLTASRGLHAVGFSPTGVRVPVDLTAEEPALEALASLQAAALKDN